MSFFEKRTVEYYIREISELMVPVTATINDTIELPNCLLFYETWNSGELLVQTRPGKYPKIGEVAITCVYSKALYIFKSKIIGIKKIDSKYAYLRIRIPETIAIEERRRFFRVKPSEREPVYMQFLLADKRRVTVEAMDISGGGLSCVLPNNLAKFKTGNSFHAAITLPAFGEIQAWVTVLSMIRLFNMVRIGMVYSIMSEPSHSLVMSYVTTREQDIKHESRNVSPVQSFFGKAEICLVEQEQHHDQYGFLENIFNVVKTDFSGAVSTLTAHPPELIILSDSKPSAIKTLEDIRRRRALKDIPLIVLTEKEKVSCNVLKNVVTINTTCHKRFLIQTAESLVEEYRLYKNITVKSLNAITGKGRRILIIDHFHHFSKNNIKALTDCGFEVSVNRNENNILTKTRQMHPDIILVDEEMENTNPLSMCRTINMNKSMNMIPKIIVTSSRKTFNKFYSQGFFAGFITKPVNPKQLLSRVFEVIPQRNKRQ
jgi:DNA-binding response OmpR family regulator/c-di-GMP-binding flagellar brake protein YcgR